MGEEWKCHDSGQSITLVKQAFLFPLTDGFLYFFQQLNWLPKIVDIMVPLSLVFSSWCILKHMFFRAFKGISAYLIIPIIYVKKLAAVYFPQDAALFICQFPVNPLWNMMFFIKTILNDSRHDNVDRNNAETENLPTH